MAQNGPMPVPVQDRGFMESIREITDEGTWEKVELMRTAIDEIHMREELLCA